MALRHHTLLVALAVAVVALAAPAHADNGSDPCWLWRGVMPETFEHYYFNLTAFTSEQRGEAKNDDDIVYVASLCNYTKGHSSTRTSVYLGIDGTFYSAGDYRKRQSSQLDGRRGMQVRMAGSDMCRRGVHFSTQFTFKCDSASSETRYTCEYDEDKCMLKCKVHSRHACYILGDP